MGTKSNQKVEAGSDSRASTCSADAVDKAMQMILEATDGAVEGCGLVESVAVLISQRDNAYHYSDTFRAKLKKLGRNYV